MMPIPETATATEILLAIDNWSLMAEKKREPAKLYHILSALRGPDRENSDLKLATTAIIRKASLPNLCHTQGATLNFEDKAIKRDRETHFSWHIAEAADALNLPEEEEEED